MRFHHHCRFRAGDEDGLFYLFVYDVESTICVAHGLNSTFVGMTLSGVYESVNIPLNATQLHNQFTNAAARGGGWVLYDWLIPGKANSDFQKVSYMFQINLNGKTYYGGIGFNHNRGPTEAYADSGQKDDGSRILCTTMYGLYCNKVNAQAVVGQATAELRLSSTEASVTTLASAERRDLAGVLSAITDRRDPWFSVNDDFHVSVFSVEADDFCSKKDGSGCCLASGANPEWVRKTWQDILDYEGVASVKGFDLHGDLVAISRPGGEESAEMSWSGRTASDPTSKMFWATRFRNGGKEYYVVSEYFTTPQPPTCNDCPSGEECTSADQSYCKEKPPPPITKHPAFVTILVLFSVGAPLAA
jgi:hypothetical protein